MYRFSRGVTDLFVRLSVLPRVQFRLNNAGHDGKVWYQNLSIFALAHTVGIISSCYEHTKETGRLDFSRRCGLAPCIAHNTMEEFGGESNVSDAALFKCSVKPFYFRALMFP